MKLNCAEPLSSFAFNLNSRRYESRAAKADAAVAQVAAAAARRDTEEALGGAYKSKYEAEVALRQRTADSEAQAEAAVKEAAAGAYTRPLLSST